MRVFILNIKRAKEGSPLDRFLCFSRESGKEELKEMLVQLYNSFSLFIQLYFFLPD